MRLPLHPLPEFTNPICPIMEFVCPKPGAAV